MHEIHSEVCGTCGGTGSVRVSVNNATISYAYEKICEQCNGTGWITITYEITYPFYLYGGFY